MSEIKRSQLWAKIQEFKEDRNQILAWVCKTLGDVIKNSYITLKIANEMTAFKKAKDQQNKLWSDGRQALSPPTDKVFFDPTDMRLERKAADETEDPDEEMETPMEVDEDASPKPASKFLKSFSTLSPGGKRSRTDQIYAMCLQYVDKENADNPTEDEFTINNLLGYLLKRANYHSNPKVAAIGKLLELSQPVEQGHFDVNQAVALSQHLELSREKQQILKNWMAKVNVKLPGKEAMFKVRQQMKPAISPLSEFEDNRSEVFSGVAVSYRELVLKTDASIIDVINFRDPEALSKYEHLNAVYKDGSDGSGCQPAMQTASNYQAAENIYAHAIVPIRMEGIKSDGTTETLWQNRAPNAARVCRPYSLIRSQESTDVVTYDVEYVDREIKKLQSESAAVVSFRNPCVAHQVTHEINSTMKDLKMKKVLSGQGGADCLLCKEKQAAWMDVDKIKDGFPITRNVEESKHIWEMMAKDKEEGRKTDPVLREGQTKPPITIFEQRSICITHTYINVTNWYIKLLARLDSDRTWVERGDPRGDPIRGGTERVQEAIYKAKGKRYNQVGNSVAKTGGSTTGQSGREFFTEEFLPAILQRVDDKDKEAVSKLHRNLSTIFRAFSCTKEIDLVKFEQLVQDTSIHIAEKFPWARINFTLHGALHHSAELMAMNQGRGLGEWSEEALEANNKYIRRFAETRSRKVSPNAQLTDVLGLLIERSCPFTLEMQQMVRPAKEPCAECGSKKHATKSHRNHTNTYDEDFNDIILH